MSVNPFHELHTFAVAVRNETFERHAPWAFLKSLPPGMDTSYVDSELTRLQPFPSYFRVRVEKLKGCLDAALLAAERTGFSVDEVSRRINALADPIKHLILWEKNYKQGAPPSFIPERDWRPPPVPRTYFIGDYTRVPGGPYLRYYDHALLAALPAVRELSMRAGTSSDSAEGGEGEGIDEQNRQGRVASLTRSIRKAYLSFEAARVRAEKKDMADWEAYQLLKEEGIPADSLGELADYLEELPTFLTWRRYLSKARQLLDESKHTRRRGRPHGGSIVRQNQIEQPDNDDE